MAAKEGYLECLKNNHIIYELTLEEKSNIEENLASTLNHLGEFLDA
jgi:hypothetical protein